MASAMETIVLSENVACTAEHRFPQIFSGSWVGRKHHHLIKRSPISSLSLHFEISQLLALLKPV